MISPAYAVRSVNLMADTSISVAMAQIARDYARDQRVVVNASFAGLRAQENQITDGGAVDVLITPKLAWIDQLKTQGLVDVYSQITIAKNPLALVGPADSEVVARPAHDLPVSSLIKAIGGEPGFVVGNPETLMVGIYGKQALRRLGAADELEPYTLYIKQADQMFDMVQKQHAYGIFLHSTVLNKQGVRIIDVLPENSHQPINYYAVVIAGENMDEARKFLDYLKMPSTQKRLRDSGFLTDRL